MTKKSQGAVDMSDKDKKDDKKTKKTSVMDEGKKQALNLALSQITKQFGDGSIMKLGEKSKIDVELFSSGSLAFDLAAIRRDVSSKFMVQNRLEKPL